ncbi:hypothetical protein COLO4_36530 [Corchorus olitorius]|uniref:RNase H type-1 domain-containing protein n=1 Tax=Corchorus olitorius TaxID=93759 RepID=A0A1R3G889_9ROSI|nr:hypothetical protein COLO4_36530 [Corchorus olitorius]
MAGSERKEWHLENIRSLITDAKQRKIERIPTCIEGLRIDRNQITTLDYWLMNMFKDHMSKVQFHSERQWEAPEEGWTKLNCDGAIDLKTCSAGIWIVARNGKGIMIGGVG